MNNKKDIIPRNNNNKKDIIPRNNNNERHGLCETHWFISGNIMYKSYYQNNRKVGYSELYFHDDGMLTHKLFNLI